MTLNVSRLIDPPGVVKDWKDLWGLFNKAQPQARVEIWSALNSENIWEWLKTCPDDHREKALQGAPLEVALQFIGFIKDADRAERIALQYSEKYRPLLDSMWRENSPENLKACLLVVRRLK